jgi:transcriptional regulator with XRE-family HTH domain
MDDIIISSKIAIIRANIIQERQRLNYTQEYLGYKLGISQNAYSKIELGYTRITVKHFFHIAEILGCSPLKLLGENAGNK